MLENEDTVGMVLPAVMAGLRKCLASRQALNLDLILANQAGEGRDLIMKALEGLVSRREVEVLCPVTVGFGGGSKPTFHPLEHYRLVRATDHDHAWQVDITESPVDFRWVEERELRAARWTPERHGDSAWFLPWRQPVCAAAG
jgi:hypothetical protein